MSSKSEPVETNICATKMNNTQTNSVSLRARLVWAIKKIVKSCLILIAFYLAIAVVGLIPVNNDFQPTPDGIEIIIVSNLVHTDILVPVQSDAIDWRTEFPKDTFQGDVDGYSHIAFGWGDEGFFVNTPQWSDLTVSTAFNAIFLPSTTCMHVSYELGEWCRPLGKSVKISQEQYQKIVDQFRTSFQRDDQGRFIQLQAAYGMNDAFFKAKGSYHCFNTCNSWTGRVLKEAGVRVPWYSPLPKTVFLWLPD